MKERFPNIRKSKLSPQGDGPFQMIKKINNNAYQLDLPAEYGVHPTFNITDLDPFVGIFDEKDNRQDLRANPLQGGGDDVTPTSPSSSASTSPSLHQGPITRSKEHVTLARRVWHATWHHQGSSPTFSLHLCCIFISFGQPCSL